MRYLILAALFWAITILAYLTVGALALATLAIYF